jgi:sugar transferase (PEP-CTERM/EpsH1 system associated)
VLRGLQPDIVHTRNLAALEGQIPALLARGAARVHGEHGRDVFDLHGANRKYNLLRKAIRPLVKRYIAVSQDLAQWLIDQVGVRPDRVHQIYNGVDQERFRPRRGPRPALLPEGFAPPDAFVVGTVGRLAEVKDQTTLIRAYARVLRGLPRDRSRLRLVIVGDGEMRGQLEACIRQEDLADHVWLAGDREDIPDMLRLLDLFVLPSLGEGISNTILEAMACALPVVATRVGGNPEVVEDGVTGTLVPVSDPDRMGAAIAAYVRDRRLCDLHGRAGLDRVSRHFQWDRCVNDYLAVYDDVLGLAGSEGGVGRDVVGAGRV